jgi:hypothetical protein
MGTIATQLALFYKIPAKELETETPESESPPAEPVS